MKKSDNIIMLLIITIITFIILVFFIFTIKQVYREKEFKNSLESSDHLDLFYLYGAKNHKSIKEIYNEKNILNRLEKFNTEINSLENGEFIEIKDELLQLKGFFDNDYEFINGYTKYTEVNDIQNENELAQEYINQSLVVNGKEGLYSNVKSLRIAERAFGELANSLHIDSGRGFNSEDYYVESNPLKINVILGYKYEDIFDLNSEFKALYLGQEINFKVIGFLGKDTVINIDPQTKLCLDYYIIFPSFNLDLQLLENNKELNEFAISHYLEKNYGYIIPNNKENIRNIVEIVDNLSKSNDLDYECVPNSNTNVDLNVFRDLFFNIKILIECICIIISASIFIALAEIKIIKRSMDNRELQSNKKIYFIYVNVFFCFLVGFIIALVLYYLFNKNNVSVFMLLDALKIGFFVETIIMICTFWYLHYKLNKLVYK